MRAQADRVDPGGGPPGGVYGYILAGDLVRRAFDRGLDARPVVLPLPAIERAAGIFDRQRESSHNFVPAGTENPRKNSSDVMMPRPARWTSVGLIAPVPQAIVRSLVTVPGAPMSSV